MPKGKVTGGSVAGKASKVLTSKETSTKSKSAAGSALSQTKAPGKTTSKVAASAASKVLRDGRTSNASKSAAGSALSQRARTVMSPKAAGTVTKSSVARAVSSVSSRRSGKK